MRELITTVAVLSEIPADSLLTVLRLCDRVYGQPVLEVSFQGQTATVTVSKQTEESK